MIQPLPTSYFKFVHPSTFKIEDYVDKGTIIECDLNYPDNLHDSHSMYPLAPEKYDVTCDDSSSYCKKIHFKFNLFKSYVAKLVPN